jgi:light-independent protochlorophyllide reductase subunit B
MFREDFEFHDGAAPSHLGSHGASSSATARAEAPPIAAETPMPMPMPLSPEPLAAVAAAPAVAAAVHESPVPSANGGPVSLPPLRWAADAEKELQKIPFFVRGKARRNTERFAQDRGLSLITVETLYDAKAHFSR